MISNYSQFFFTKVILSCLCMYHSVVNASSAKIPRPTSARKLGNTARLVSDSFSFCFIYKTDFFYIYTYTFLCDVNSLVLHLMAPKSKLSHHHTELLPALQ